MGSARDIPPAAGNARRGRDTPDYIGYSEQNSATSLGSSIGQNWNTGESPLSSIATNIKSKTTSTQIDFTGQSADGQAFPEPSSFPVAGLLNMDLDIDQFWTAMDWRLMHTQAW